MPAPTDSQYNALSRQVIGRVDIYFTETPVSFYYDDYLVDLEVLEELAAEDTNPLGAISANTLDVTLLNQGGIFNPLNASSPYFGLIREGLKIIPYVRPDDLTDWTQVGTFYVADWSAKITDLVASVYATDNLQDVMSGASITTQLLENITYDAFIRHILSLKGFTVSAVATLNDVIPFAYINGNLADTLQKALNGSIAACTTKHDGQLQLIDLNAVRTLRATITDNDQVISIDSTQSILKTYNGTSLTYKLPQVVPSGTILDVQNVNVSPGTNILDPMQYSKTPIKAIDSIVCTSDDDLLEIVGFESDAFNCYIEILNSGVAVHQGSIQVYGEAITFVDTLLQDVVNKPLSITNEFIQTSALATAYKDILNAYVGSVIPVLRVSIRGNPLLQLNDKIRVVSTKYNTDFTGILWRASYKYNGALSCDLVLLNVDIFE